MTDKPTRRRTEGDDSQPNPSVLASSIPVLLVWILALTSCQPLDRKSTKGFPDTLRPTEAMNVHDTIPTRSGYHPDSLVVPGVTEPFQVLVNIERQEIVVTSTRETLQVEENTEVSKSHFLPNYARTDDFNFDGIHEVYIQTYCGRNCGGEVYSHDKNQGGFRKVRSVNNHELHPETHILSEGGSGGRTASQVYSWIRKDWTDSVLLMFERIEDSAFYCRPDGTLICNISYTPSDTCGDFPNRYLPLVAKNLPLR